MSIPNRNDIKVPVLQLLKEHNSPLATRIIYSLLSKHFNLTEEDKARRLLSGEKSFFHNRVRWALYDLKKLELISISQRAHYLITDRGKEYLSEFTDDKKLKNGEGEQDTIADEIDPVENLDAMYKKYKQYAFDEIMETIHSKTPYEFERIVLRLLHKMGYGDGTFTQLTKKSNDGGIDGIIKEDILGLNGNICIQTKQYTDGNNIGREAIQKFVGAMGDQHDKGVFVTTSDYTENAREEVKNIKSKRIELIDGKTLCEYIYKYGLGMQTKQSFEIKEVDDDFWDEFDNKEED